MNCPICNTHTMKVAYAGPIRGGLVADILQCRSCGTQHYPNALKLSDYQSGAYRDSVGHDQHGDTLDTLVPFKEFNGKVVLDVGCGNGLYIQKAATEGAIVYGIEPDERERAALSDRYPVFESLDAAKHIKADYILCLTVIEHVENPVEFLHMLGDMLAPTGRIILTTPNRNSLLMRLLDFDYCQWFYRPAHRWYWDRNSLEKTLALAGLQTNAHVSYEPYGFWNFVHWLKEKQPAKGWKLESVQHVEAMDFALKAWEMDMDGGHYLLNIIGKRKTQ